MSEDVRVVLDPRSLSTTLRSIKEFSPALATATRRRLRAAGEGIVKDMRSAVTSGRLGGAGPSSGMRQGVAAGLKVAVVAGQTRQGINIVAVSDKMPAGKAAMVKAWNSKSFRHPVFGDRSTFVSQAGRPYFGSVIASKKDDMAQAIQLALNDALREING